MESLGVQARPAPYLQPAHALQGDVAAVLREGRVLAGEVLQRLDGSSLLIGIGGRYRVPANSRAELQPGDRFLFQVQRAEVGGAASELVLRVLEGEERESLLLRTLRGRTSGAPIDLGQALLDLGKALRGGGPRAEALLAALRGGAFSAEQATSGASGSAADALRAALQFGGVRHEAALLDASFSKLPAGARPGELAHLLVERALGGELAAEASSTRAVLQPAIASLHAGLDGALFDDLESILRSVADKVRARPVPDASSASLRAQLANGLESLARGGALTESVRRLVQSQFEERELAGLRGNRKALLLGALFGEGESELSPAAREAGRQTLRALESEQLQSVLRREVGAAQRFSLPFLSGNEVHSAKLWVERPKADERSASPAREEDRRTRATVALELSALGPVRVDVLLHGERVALRALVSTEEAAVALRAGFEGLRQRLEAGGQELLGGGVTVERDPARLRAEDLEGGREALGITRSSPFGHHVLNTLG